MRKALPFAAALVLLSGCIVYRMDKTPPCDGLSDAARAECKFKPKCLLKCDMKVQTIKNPVHGDEPIHYGGTKGSLLIEQQKDAFAEAIQGCALFAECRRVESLAVSGVDVVGIEIMTDFSYDLDFLTEALTIFTLSLFPGNLIDYYFKFEINVTDGWGLQRQYRFKETIKERFGLLCLFAMPSLEYNGSHVDVFAAMNRKVMNNLFVKMQQDGFFSAEARDKAAAKAKVVETVKKTVAGRRKELEDLKKAGIIDEAEYAAEVKKLEGAGK